MLFDSLLKIVQNGSFVLIDSGSKTQIVGDGSEPISTVQLNKRILGIRWF